MGQECVCTTPDNYWPIGWAYGYDHIQVKAVALSLVAMLLYILHLVFLSFLYSVYCAWVYINIEKCKTLILLYYSTI